jgi:hypothetical protein
MWEIGLVLIIIAAIGLLFIVGFILGACEAFSMIEEDANTNDYHDCDDYLIYDEGHPEKPFKCTKCNKKY